MFYVENAGWYPLEGEFHALGAGQPAALAAMHMGASAVKAVEIAIKLDKNSGPPVMSLCLADIAAFQRCNRAV